MSMALGSRRGPEADINVTPLIDVLLVLLIVFMVILPKRNFGEEADIPLPNPPDVQGITAQEKVVLQLLDRGEGRHPILKINQQEIAWEKLEQRLQTIFAARADKTGFFKGDADLEFRFVAEAIDIMHQAGAEGVALLGPKD